MTTLTPIETSETEIHEDMFGGNTLGYRDRIGEDGTFDDAIEALNIGAIRYPGGGYTEGFFDISDPDRVEVVNVTDGTVRENMPYSEFMGWAEEEGISVTVVLPTRTQLSEETDENGNRYPDIDEEVLRQFVRDTLDGVYGSPEIDAFELGNEYWGSGFMTSVEYGRLAAEMAVIVRDEINKHPEGSTADIDIAVQMGQNYDYANLSNVYEETGQDLLDRLTEDYGIEFDDSYLYGSGQGAWPRIQNKLLISQFDTPESQEAITAVVAHYYSRYEASEQGSFDLSVIEKEWDPVIPGLSRYVTEWNLKVSVDLDPVEDYGLKNAHEILNLIENMTDQNVEMAHVWAVQQNTPTDLAFNEGEEGLSVVGEMFALMSENLPGTKKVKLDGSIDTQDEVSTGTSDAHFFYGEEGGVLFLASTSEEASTEELDLSALMSDLGDVTVTRLGVEEGAAPDSARSLPEVSTIDPADVVDGLSLEIEMGPYEIVMFRFEGATATPELEALLSDTTIPDDGNDGTSGNQEDDDDEDEDDEDKDPDDEGEDGTCFVATAAYGDPYHPDVAWLRAFRDEHLLPHPIGRAFLKFYWTVGPRLAGIVRARPALAALGPGADRPDRAPRARPLGLRHPDGAALLVCAIQRPVGDHRVQNIAQTQYLCFFGDFFWRDIQHGLIPELRERQTIRRWPGVDESLSGGLACGLANSHEVQTIHRDKHHLEMVTLRLGPGDFLGPEVRPLHPGSRKNVL